MRSSRQCWWQRLPVLHYCTIHYCYSAAGLYADGETAGAGSESEDNAAAGFAPAAAAFFDAENGRAALKPIDAEFKPLEETPFGAFLYFRFICLLIS